MREEFEKKLDFDSDTFEEKGYEFRSPAIDRQYAGERHQRGQHGIKN